MPQGIRGSRPRCSIEGCSRPHKAHGYCPFHYQRWRLNGDPLATKPMGKARKLPGDYEGLYRCRVCGEEKPHTEFYLRPPRSVNSKPARLTICNACGHHRTTGYNLRSWYGLSSDEHAAMLAAQEGRCKLCGRKPPARRLISRSTGEPFSSLHVDHDHQTGRVRGLLCGSCNQVLERVDAVGIEAITAYLQP